jgi:tetratricopeptide (TPR) repeat protein
MKTIITAVVFFVCSLLSAQTQYEQGMGKAMQLWGAGNNTEAVATFERIASVEKTNWLPNYYIAFINTIEAFGTKDKEKANALITKAQDAIDSATLISPNNTEIMVVQAMLYTAILVQDPMTNGQKYGALAMEQYNKALAIDPKNPRVLFSKAEFEIGGAKYWGTDTKPMCDAIAKSLELFANFKPESQFHPSWGADRAEKALAECKK